MFNKTEHVEDPEVASEMGLCLCTVCGGIEGALPSHCPGTKMTHEQLDAVYRNQINFVNGKWFVLEPKPYGGPK